MDSGETEGHREPVPASADVREGEVSGGTVAVSGETAEVSGETAAG